MATPTKPHKATRFPKRGRPPKKEWTKEELEQFEVFVKTYPTLADTALFFKVSTSEIEHMCTRYFKLNFSDVRAGKMAWTKHLLKKQAIDLAMHPTEPNVPMLKFCLTNLCQWSDKNEMQLQTTTVQIDIQDDEL